MTARPVVAFALFAACCTAAAAGAIALHGLLGWITGGGG